MNATTCCPNCYNIHTNIINVRKCWQEVLNEYLSISNVIIASKQELKSTQLKYYDMFDYIFDFKEEQ